MTRKEAIEFGEERLGLFGGKMDEFIRFAINDMKMLEERTQYIKVNGTSSDYFEERVNTVEAAKLLQEANNEHLNFHSN